MCLFINGLFSSLTTMNCSSFLGVNLLPPPTEMVFLFTKKFVFLLYLSVLSEHKHNLLHQQGPILTSLSEGLLIFHNQFACFHCVFRDKYLQPSQESNIYEKHTCHWKKKNPRRCLPGRRISLGVCEGSQSLDFSAVLLSIFLLLLHDNGYWK